jgi:D-cysteine desulfhydrase family pyridoxal phosphate-dependent enzyme
MDEKLFYLEEKLKTFPQQSLSLVPTPCHRISYLSDRYGVEIYCKRDDLTGFGFGGNKSRKLEFLIGEALEHGCDTIVTSGGLQSNFCRLTAAAGAVTDMSVHLVLGGGRPAQPTGNLILDEMLGAEIHFVNSTDWNDWEAECAKVVTELEIKGRKVFRIPIGGSVPVGVAGYVSAFIEIMKDQERLGLSFDHIIHASGSGGTQAGLVVGKALMGWDGKISGISVSMDGETLEELVFALAVQTAGLFGGSVSRESVVVADHYIGEGYAIKTVAAEKAMEVFARKEGIFLDNVYTGKAASALLDWLEKGALSGQSVLFLHTGGQAELFAKE